MQETLIAMMVATGFPDVRGCSFHSDFRLQFKSNYRKLLKRLSTSAEVK